MAEEEGKETAETGKGTDICWIKELEDGEESDEVTEEGDDSGGTPHLGKDVLSCNCGTGFVGRGMMAGPPTLGTRLLNET